MGATVTMETKKKAPLTFAPAREVEPQREFQIPSHAESAPGAGHDFGRISVLSEAPRPAVESCPRRATPSRCPFGGACHTCPTHVQRKLAIGEAGDAYEREADRVAAQVMRMPAPPAAAGPSSPAGLGLAEAPPIVHEVLQSPGQPLDTATRETMQSRLGYDFGSVRVHDDGKAAESARAVNALAYTVGSDVVFREGQTRDGGLLAHELAHVVQQGAGRGASAKAPRRARQGLLATEGDRPREVSAVETVSAAPRMPVGASVQRQFASAHMYGAGGGFQGLMERDRRRTAEPPASTSGAGGGFANNPRYCKDTALGGLLHRGVCYREVVAPCERGRHVCVDPASGAVTSDHHDTFSPVERREPNGDCNYHGPCAYSHIVTEVPASWGFPYLRRLAEWLREKV